MNTAMGNEGLSFPPVTRPTWARVSGNALAGVAA
ncbi:hypothetical protein D806_052610 [Mycolicibacterium smegmatis MKD8]|uniref:Uncharacterized protein n=1 Tax=Mycolicibacterium smegmatis (strain MKD8) TaxID=1214915 RepID=A0A2U9PWM7_MYCSE|nr:hypothetical protein D806_052610 [Mycolicibacterium smegmatis MKD8]